MFIISKLISIFEFYFNLGVIETPIIRKIIDVGDSKAVTLPKTWIEFFEKEEGKPIQYLTIEVDRELKILPYFKERLVKL